MVGGGILDFCAERADLTVAKVLVRRPRPELGSLAVTDIADITGDPIIGIVIEVMGGLHPAYEYICAALRAGKHVVTANKAVISAFYSQLTQLAAENGVSLRCTAAVGGGIPWLVNLERCKRLDAISELGGIMNGTTNFIMDAMHAAPVSFPEILKQAQELGYAETKDPGDDVDGRDACRKIAILSSLVCGHQIYPQNIPTRGIRDITVDDVASAEKLGCVIKLIAWMKRGEDGSVAAGVEPCLVPKANQLAGVDDVFNAVLVKGDMLGDVVFYGKGAGKLPTASAVVADVVDALKNGSKVHDSLFWQPADPVDGMLTDPAPAAYYVRVAGIAPAVVEAIYGYGKVVDERYEGCAYFVKRADERALAEAARKVEAVGGSVKLVLKRLPEEA